MYIDLGQDISLILHFRVVGWLWLSYRMKCRLQTPP